MTGQWDEAVAGEEQRGQRLDKYVSALSEDCSRLPGSNSLEEGHITVNGQPEKANYRIRPGDVVRWCIPEPDMLSAEPEPMDLEIVYEDEYLAIVNKPRGMVVHPAAGHAGERSSTVSCIIFREICQLSTASCARALYTGSTRTRRDCWWSVKRTELTRR